MNSTGSEWNQVADSCEHSYKLSGSIKVGEFLDQLGDCQLLKDSASYS
jgi:hypothetical protein